MYRVMVVDDYEPFCEVACQILGQGQDFEVVSVATCGEEAVRLARELEPDLVLMDVQLEGMNGPEAAKQILGQRPATKVVLLSMYQEKEYSRLAVEVGALAFIAKRDLNLHCLRQILKAGNLDEP